MRQEGSAIIKQMNEKLVAIMSHKKATKMALICSAVLVTLLAGCAAMLGAGSGSGGLPLQETPQIYVLEADKPFESIERMPTVTLYESGSARLSQPLISSYAFTGLGKYSFGENTLSVTQNGREVKFDVSEDGKTLTVRSTDVLFSEVGAAYKMQTKAERYADYEAVDGETLTVGKLRELAKQPQGLTRTDFERYKHIKNDPDILIFDVEGEYTLTYRVGYDGSQGASYVENKTGVITALKLADASNEMPLPAYDPDFEFRSEISVKTLPGRYTQSLSGFPGILISVEGRAVGGASLKYEAESGKFAVNDDGIIADLGNPAIREFGASPSAHWSPDSNTKDGDIVTITLLGEDGETLAQVNMAVDVQDGWYSLLPTSKTPHETKVRTLDEAVSQAILDTCYTGFESEGILLPTESHITLKTVEDGDKTTVYAMAYETVYSFEDGKLREEGGSHMPVAITFEKTSNGGYELLEYWIPKDGSYYRPSIQDKFPRDLWSKVDTQTYVAEQITAVLRTAQAYFALTDHTPPTIQELAPLEIAKGSALDPSKYLSISDDVDGEIPLSEAYIWDAGIDLSRSGDYSFQVIVKDNAGNENRSDFKMKVI